MTLLFNLTQVQPIHSAKFHGGGTYGEVVFFALVRRLPLQAFRLVCIYDSKKYLNEAILTACKEQNISLYDIQNISPSELVVKESIDTFYTPLHSLNKKWDLDVKRYLFTWHGVRALEMNYDPIAVRFAKKITAKLEAFVRYRKIWKDFYYAPKYKSLVKQVANGKAEFITVSEHSKASIRSFFPELMEIEISAFYSPLMDSAGEQSVSTDESSRIQSPYFLLISGARWEKNNFRAIQAFDLLFSEQPKINHKVILTGATNKKIYERTLKNKDNFIFLDYVENDQLEFLHKNAYAFIFPSLNEGFGYPPIQSMRYGVPVAASGTSSIPEICGDAAIYFDPYSVSEIKNRIIQLLNKEIHCEYAKRAKVRYKIVSERQKTDLESAVDWIISKVL
ncbi:mannosyltransferase [Fibrobacterales bacterium]|nr:mannosyltransferase [Fibrobacterales bacterium]